MEMNQWRTSRLSVVAAPLFLMLTNRMASAETPSTARHDGSVLKTESFDRDPGWLGINNRSARRHEARQVRQDFGYGAGTHHAGGEAPGEIGGFISPAGEAAFYGKIIEPRTLDQPLRASGKLVVGGGATHLLLGFFNASTVNEWRTPNTLAIRLHGRGDKFFAYVEYCTSKWRAGGDTTPFPSATDPRTGRQALIGFPCDKSLDWTLTYDPGGNAGSGVVMVRIGNGTTGTATAVCNLDPGHKADGAVFNRFGLMNVIKSADSGSEVWLDDVQVNGRPTETFDRDPNWDGRNNRRTIHSTMVRPWFDFGYSKTNFAGGKARGELGGQIFRGDCRYGERMACYGDRVGPLTLEKPLTATGKIALTRGVTDSTVLFGFYNGRDSMRQNDSQSDGLPESVLGIHIEGPSRDGFRFYPVLRLNGESGKGARPSDFPFIRPDAKSHDWKLAFDPQAAKGKGRVTVTLDGTSNTFDLEPGLKARSGATTFDRFGIVTSWIDGNSQDVYWDDIAYTVRQE